MQAVREPLGVFNAWTWARQFKDKDGQRAGVCESTRWIESYERIADSAKQLPDTRHVCVGARCQSWRLLWCSSPTNGERRLS